jgi:hypothetical protein
MVYFNMAGFEGGQVALNCALEGIRPRAIGVRDDYPQDFTEVNTDTGKGMSELKNYIETSYACSRMGIKVVSMTDSRLTDKTLLKSIDPSPAWPNCLRHSRAACPV